jgi:hypothetical protein
VGDLAQSDTAVSVTLSEEELLGLHVLATLEGVPAGDASGMSDLVSRTVRRGLMGRFDLAGLPWPPTKDALETAQQVAEQAESAEVESESGPRRHVVRNLAIAAAALATIVVIIGGYAGHWAWTGFQSNGQLWDWIHLLLLPVAFGTFPLWLRFSDQMDAAHRRLLGTAALAFVLFVLAGYLAPLVWTGFRGQTLWNWLTLIVLPITLTTVRTWPTTGREVRRVHVIAAGSLAIGWIVTLVGGYAFGWTWTGYEGNKLWDWMELLLSPIAINIFVVPALIKLVSGNVAERAEQEMERIARGKALSAAHERISRELHLGAADVASVEPAAPARPAPEHPKAPKAQREGPDRNRLAALAAGVVVVAAAAVLVLVLTSGSSPRPSPRPTTRPTTSVHGPTTNTLGQKFNFTITGKAAGPANYLYAWEQRIPGSGCASTYAAEKARTTSYQLEQVVASPVSGPYSLVAGFSAHHLGEHGICAYLINESSGTTYAHAGAFWTNVS